MIAPPSTVANPADPGNGSTPPVFLSFGSDLSAYAGQSVRIRWRFTSDGGAEFSGFWLDEVRIGGTTIIDPIFSDGFDGAAPRSGGGVITGGDYVRSHAAPMMLTYAIQSTERMIFSGNEVSPPDVKKGWGVLETYVCRSCGFVEWYCQAPDDLPVGPAFNSELVKVDDPAYRR